MATKVKFIKGLKEVKKTAVNDLVNAGIRSGSTVGTAFILNGKLGAKIPAKIAKWRGPIVLGLGLIGDVFSGNEKMKAAFQGMACYGALESTADIAFKGDGSKVGLAPRKSIQGVGAKEEKIDWDALAKKAEEEAQMSGLSGANLEAVIEVIGEDKRQLLEGWLRNIEAGKWGFKNQGEKNNIAGALWQMYNNQKAIDGTTYKAALEANNSTEEDFDMSGVEVPKMTSKKSSIKLD